MGGETKPEIWLVLAGARVEGSPVVSNAVLAMLMGVPDSR